MAELDHVFVCCSAGADVEANALTRLGLVEGTGNTHPGQGTASRRFFFESAYLELFWVSDDDEARGPLAAPTRLFERWSRRRSGACPFAVMTRPSDPDHSAAPYPSWAYHPEYLPPELAIDVAEDTPLSEPAFFHLGFALRGRATTPQPRSHALGVTDITRVTIALTGPGPLSAAAKAIEDARIAAFARAGAFLMTLTFDGAAAGRSADLRPDLPLVLEW